MQLRYLGTSAFVMTTADGRTLIVDPYLNDNPDSPIKAADLTHVDVVLVTHGGFDHLGDAFEIVGRTGAMLVASADVALAAKHIGITPKLVFPMVSGARYTHAGFTIQAVEAHHVSITVLKDCFISGQPLSYIIWPEPSRPDLSFYHGGDTSLFSDMKLIAELYHPGIGLIGMGGRPDLPHEMTGHEAAIAAEWLGVSEAIPMHWVPGSPEPEEFRVAVAQRAPHIRVHIPRSGETMTFPRQP